jgi:hypothetical protein
MPRVRRLCLNNETFTNKTSTLPGKISVNANVSRTFLSSVYGEIFQT